MDSYIDSSFNSINKRIAAKINKLIDDDKGGTLAEHKAILDDILNSTIGESKVELLVNYALNVKNVNLKQVSIEVAEKGDPFLIYNLIRYVESADKDLLVDALIEVGKAHHFSWCAKYSTLTYEQLDKLTHAIAKTGRGEDICNFASYREDADGKILTKAVLLIGDLRWIRQFARVAKNVDIEEMILWSLKNKRYLHNDTFLTMLKLREFDDVEEIYNKAKEYIACGVPPRTMEEEKPELKANSHNRTIEIQL